MQGLAYAPVAYLRDTEDAGSLVPCLRGDPGAMIYLPAETVEEVVGIDLWPTRQELTADYTGRHPMPDPSGSYAPVAYLRDIDGTGSLHACRAEDPGAIAYVPADTPEEVGDAEIWETCQELTMDFQYA